MSGNSEVNDAEELFRSSKKIVAISAEGVKQRRWVHRRHLGEMFSDTDELLQDQSWLERLGGAFEAAHLILEQKAAIAFVLQQENQPEEITLAIRKKTHELRCEIEGIANELQLFGDHLAQKAQSMRKITE